MTKFFKEGISTEWNPWNVEYLKVTNVKMVFTRKFSDKNWSNQVIFKSLKIQYKTYKKYQKMFIIVQKEKKKERIKTTVNMCLRQQIITMFKMR